MEAGPMDEKEGAGAGGGADNTPPSAEEFMATMNDRFEKMETLLETLNTQRPLANGLPLVSVISSIFSSGFFFLVLGGGLIFLAQGHMSTNHAGITFVLVVLGVALLLYGTGTQGMGQFNNGAGYSVAIAGGAGIVAFAVAFGMIMYSKEMRDAFQPERKFVRVLVQGGDGLTDISQYASTFEMDGVPVPAARKGRNVEVYVPYLPYEIAKKTKQVTPAKGAQAAPAVDDDKGMCPTTENREALGQLDMTATARMISARFYRVETAGNPDTLLPRADTEFMVRFDQAIFRSADGGIDYPSYPVRICVNLQQVERAKELLAAAQMREIASPTANKLKQNLPPALIEAQ
jgi:hypothetical protein